MITCPNCGTQLPEGTAFCSKCGAPQTAARTAMSAPPQFSQTNFSEKPKSKIPVWGWVLGGCIGVCGFGTIILAAVLFPVFQQARLAARKTVAISNAKQVGLATIMYTNDFDDRMPPFKYSAQAEKYVDSYLNSSDQRLKKAAQSYEWNSRLSGFDLKDLVAPEQVWMFHTTNRVGDSFCVVFADGHAHLVKQEELDQITAAPFETSKVPSSKKP